MKALLVIDIAERLLSPKMVCYHLVLGREIIRFIKERIAEFRAQGAPVIFICDHHEQDDKEFRSSASCLAGSPGSQIIANEVQPGTRSSP